MYMIKELMIIPEYRTYNIRQETRKKIKLFPIFLNF